MEDTIKIEDLNNIEKKICIHVAPETVGKKFSEFFSSIKKDVQIPGFRKGKVPLDVLKKYFKDQAKTTISQMLISEYYQNALRDYNINPIGNPTIKGDKEDKYVGQFNDDSSYSIEMVIEVLPTIDPTGYDKIELQMPEHNIDEICDARMTEYQEQFAEREQITESGAQLNDTLVIDFKGYIDDKPFQGGEESGFSLEKLGSGNLIPGFEDQLVGMCVNESKRIKVTFPQEYHATHLAAKDAEFDVTVHSIVRKTPAKVDDDLAMMVGYNSVDELKEHVKEEMLAELQKSDRSVLEGVIVKHLLENNDFDIPKSLLINEQNRLLKQNNIHNPNEHVLEKVKEAATNNLKRVILLDAIYEKEDVDVTPDELNEYLEEQAKLYGKDKDEIVSMLYNTNQMDAFVSVLRSRKVIDYIVNLNTKKVEADNE